MKLLSKHLEEDGPGYIKAVPDEAEDLWYAYNLIAKGDRLCAVTFRKVQKETSTGGKETERLRTKIEIGVETIEYDNVASVLRVRGKNVSENEHVKLGAYHTLEIEQQRNFVLTKDIWDSISLETLKHACDPIASADLAAVIMQEGLANVCLVGQSATIVRAKIETSIPRKRGAAIAGYDKALKKFFENVLQAILRNVDFSIVRCLIIASPGFTKDQFNEYMMLEASRKELRQIIENKSKIVLAHASSGYKHSLKEVFNAPSVANLIKDTKAAKEVKVLKDFYDMLSNNPDRAIYGPKHVEAAHEQLAIQTLLLTDELFRNADIPTRKKYVNLVRSVKDSGGEVHIFSSMHISGEQLGQLTGAAAILRFPLPELDELEV